MLYAGGYGTPYRSHHANSELRDTFLSREGMGGPPGLEMGQDDTIPAALSDQVQCPEKGSPGYARAPTAIFRPICRRRHVARSENHPGAAGVLAARCDGSHPE